MYVQDNPYTYYTSVFNVQGGWRAMAGGVAKTISTSIYCRLQTRRDGRHVKRRVRQLSALVPLFLTMPLCARTRLHVFVALGVVRG